MRIESKFPWEEHRHLYRFRLACGCMFSLWIEHDAAFPDPAPIVVAYVYYCESSFPFSPKAKVADEVGHV